VKLSKRLGGQAGGQPKVWEDHGPPRPHLEPALVACRCSCRYTLYHTENSNHLDQNIGIIWHKGSMFVNDNTAEYNVSQVAQLFTLFIFSVLLYVWALGLGLEFRFRG